MYNPTEDFEPQNPFEGMGKIKNPLEPQENEDNPFVFTGFKNPFEPSESTLKDIFEDVD